MTRRSLCAGITVALLLLSLASPATAKDEPTGRLTLASQTAWLRAGGSFDLHLVADRLDDHTDLDLAVTLGPRLRYRSEFTQTLEGTVRGSAKSLYTSPLRTVPRDPDGHLFVSLTPTLAAGVYPLTAALRVHGGAVVDRLVTHIIRVPDDPTGSLSVAWVQPIDRAADVAALGSLAEAIPVTIDATPAALTGLDAKALEPLRAAVKAGRQLLATPFADVDASALVAAGQTDDLALQRQVGEDELFAALDSRGDPRTWLATRVVTPEAVGRLRALGVTRLVVPEASLPRLSSRITGGLTVTRPFALAADGDEVLESASIDAGLAAHFHRGDQVLAAHRLLADLAVLFLDLPGTDRGIVVRPPDGWRSNASFLGTVLPALADSDILRPVTLDGLFDDVKPLTSRGETVVREPTTTKPQRALPARRLVTAHHAVDQLVGLLGRAGDAAEAARRRLLAAEDEHLSAGQRDTILDAVTGTLRTVSDRIRMPNGRTFRLTARRATIPITVINDNPFPVHVDLELSSEKVDFVDVHGADRSRQVLQDVELAADAQRTITVPVRARVSGSFLLRATLRTPGGVEIARSRLNIDSAVFSGVGIVLSIGAGLFLLLWWALHWRTVRRDRRLVDPAH